MFYPVAGIVAEYNPFHKGHMYHISKTKEYAQSIVAVLSSNFVQRGEPALLSKWKRAEAAVACGADLVIELPVVFSAHSAGVFASSAVDTLAACGVVTHLSFGTESTNCPSDNITDILLKESNAFKCSLKKYLKTGLSFAEARALAAEELAPDVHDFMKSSNNILALSYIMRIKERNYNLLPVPVARIGESYNSTALLEFSSARAIREALRAGNFSTAYAQMPAASREISENQIDMGRACISYEKYWNILRSVILRTDSETLSRYAEITEGMEHKLKSEALSAASFEEWVSACTSKRYPSGRIRRSAVKILLAQDHWEHQAMQRRGPAYIRPLAANSRGLSLLHEMKKCATLPIVTTYGQASRISSYAEQITSKELLACELWEELISNGVFGEEHKRKIIIR